MRKSVIGILGLLALSGCVNTDTMMLDSRTAVIQGRGNAYASGGQVHRKMLKEAAQKAVDAGYTHFAILKRQDASSQGMMYQPGASNTYGSAYGSCYGGMCNAYGSSSTYTSPGYAVPLTFSGADMLVRFYQADEVTPDMPGVWEAATILANN